MMFVLNSLHYAEEKKCRSILLRGKILKEYTLTGKLAKAIIRTTWNK